MHDISWNELDVLISGTDRSTFKAM